MACKGCAKRRQLAAEAIRKTYARAQVLRRRVLAKKERNND